MKNSKSNKKITPPWDKTWHTKNPDAGLYRPILPSKLHNSKLFYHIRIVIELSKIFMRSCFVVLFSSDVAVVARSRFRRHRRAPNSGIGRTETESEGDRRKSQWKNRRWKEEQHDSESSPNNFNCIQSDKIQWKPLNVIALGQTKTDNINPF